ncbi:MAG TPA: type I-U CRISPR-associated protein Csx17 [Gammaproteobacteria bacterium]|nr:type I-U CRISPR-associated protein Csx17 [Gammaproteobacteria bacterium]
MNEIVLAGCSPTPLANYLKALGVLRLLSVRYPDTRSFWRGDRFVLLTPIDKEGVIDFFLNDYQPSALVTPWNGRGGFLEGDEEGGEESSRAGAQMVRVFSGESVANRFLPLANILNSITKVNAVGHLNTERAELKRLRASEKAKGKKNLSDEEKEAISRQEALVKSIKGELLQELRNNLPDDLLPWFDACLALVNDPSSGGKKSAPSPLLGAGGLDGSMDFGVNYLKRLNDVFEPYTGLPRESAQEWLSNAFFGEPTSSLYSNSAQDKKKVSVGQFSPSDAGGYNANNGFTGEALLNPWNTILQLEGAVLFAASTVRRLEGTGDIYSSLPFTVAPTAIGEAVTPSDEAPKGAKRKTAEMWLPMWSQPAACSELAAMLREGRITLHGRSVTNGFDCVRALTSLGSSRGIEQFQRFAFLKRSGDAFFALDQGRFSVKGSAYSSFVEELDGRDQFLYKLHSFVRKKTSSGEWKASVKLRSLASQLDDHLVQLLRTDDRKILLKLLELLGDIQHVLAIKAMATTNKDGKACPPVPRLSERWVASADDDSCEFRIAKALAGLQGTKKAPLPLRAQWFPVHPRNNVWMTSDYIGKHASNDPACRVRIHTPQKGRLPDTLIALLERRLWLAEQFEMKDKPLTSSAGVTPEDVVAFLQDHRMDARIAALLPGLCLCDIPKDTDRTAGVGMLPAAFGLMKLALTPDCTLKSFERKGVKLLSKSDSVPVPAGMLAQLATGNHENRAVKIAWRRLRASGLTPYFGTVVPRLTGADPKRIAKRAAAALLIPLRYGATGMLVRTLLEEPEIEADSATTA